MPVYYYPTVGNGVPVSTVDAKGDLLVGTANDTVTRLPVGTNGFVLSANSAQASGVEWVANVSNPALGGDLSGTVSAATIVAGAVDGGKIAASIKDPVAGTAGLRTLGTGAQQAAAGNDARLSDARTPTAHVHSGADITSGKVGVAYLGATGTASASTFLRGDDSWQTIASTSARYAVKTVAAPTATGTWNADYTASGTASTSDHSTTIQTAIDSVAASGGGIVQLSDGVFLLRNSIQIKTGVWLRGQGKATKIRHNGSGSTSTWQTGSAMFILASADEHAWAVTDMRLEMRSSEGTPAQGYLHGFFLNNVAGDFSGTIDVSPDPVPMIANINFYKIKGTAIMASTDPTHTHTSTVFSNIRGATIQNCFALDSRDYALLFHASDSYIADFVGGGGANTIHQIVINGSNNRVFGCKGYYSGQANLYVGGNRNMIVGFESQDAGQDGIILAGNNSQIIGVVSDSASRLSTGAYDGILISGSRQVISASVFNRGVGWNTRCAINIGGSDNIITGTLDVNTNFTGSGGVKAYAGTRTGQTMLACTVNGESLDEFRIGTGRAYFLAPTTAASTSIIPTSGVTWYLDEASSPKRLVFQVKTSANANLTGSINVA